jgi:hypothetical protein
MRFADSLFAQRFVITTGDLDRYLSEALSQGGDYADLYFEYLLTSSIGIDESIVKSASRRASPWASASSPGSGGRRPGPSAQLDRCDAHQHSS